MPSENTKRIAKNTAFLYIRMLIMMLVAFYTSRVILNALGVEDFGIYNVVGGVVAMFSFLTGTFTSATQRFLNYEMGLGNKKRLCEIFSMSMTLNVLIALGIILLSEIIGIWFINHKLVIPPERWVAAHWVFQFSLLAMAVTIVSTPYNAVIIANERMSVFAYISILEALLKLGVAVSMFFVAADKLIVYACLIFLVAVVVRMIYSIYCRRHFQECRYRFYWDKKLFREMGSFAGWNMYGNFSFVMITQGLNMLLNMFFGPVVNASRAIAVQVQAAIQGFSSNIAMAVNPRIVQDYAQGNKEEMFRLIFFSSKYSFFLLLLLASPVILETERILNLWLGQVPEYSVVFVRLVLIQMLVRVLQNPLHTLMHATGKMKEYQLIDGSLLLLNVPASYICLRFGCDAEIIFIILIMITFVELLTLIGITKFVAGFPAGRFMHRVIFSVFKVILFLILFMWLIDLLLLRYSDQVQLVGGACLTIVFACSLIWFVGMGKQEHFWTRNYLKKLF